MRHRDGRWLVLDGGLTAIDAGGTELLLVTARDVTERTRRERAEREFVANAAHELLTPLTAMNAAIDVHELSIASAIVATVEKHAGGRPVAVVHVRVGKLRQVVPDALEFCFGMVARESVCEGAWLELEVIPGVLRCAACAHEWVIEAPPFWCPECAAGDVAAVRGEELEVDSIEIVEQEEAACIART